ncbi:fungal pheromone precursor [Wolfiporia cocos MD-104 SS10]|uniref:Fungal pheromone n=1 Tax=Wolfiporia cocos (strain MD-104) TaxID=742152 RepID=A0A2H3JVI7_WOLCO|nr:fungal pheromone precursor [Wolfiporia cocos MD-104 SS10]
MDAFFSIATPVPAEETSTSADIPADFDTTNGSAWSNCTIA